MNDKYIKKCETCEGTGRLYGDDACYACNGVGGILTQEAFELVDFLQNYFCIFPRNELRKIEW